MSDNSSSGENPVNMLSEGNSDEIVENSENETKHDAFVKWEDQHNYMMTWLSVAKVVPPLLHVLDHCSKGHTLL